MRRAQTPWIVRMGALLLCCALLPGLTSCADEPAGVSEELQPVTLGVSGEALDALAYIATGEPLPCAGAFTVDGRAAALIDRIDGDFHAVVGLSPAALRRMLAELGHPLTLVWPA